MADHAAATLALWRRSRFDWGHTDCIMATCDHIARVTGIDPAAPWRGSYDDEAGARTIYEAHGGPLGLFRNGMARAGFVTGSRGIGRPVVALVFGHEIAGLDLGDRIAFMAERRGAVSMKANVMEAWQI